ncbi:MAG: sigma-70 family RNA polymerase sigma factor [Chloroflexi bacterium]|nr:sigma-70 family RNA polymerase sigma factor [Chloroflexota bacterium]
MHEEENLVREAQGGDEKAFASLYETYVNRVYRYIGARVNNPADVEDLTEDVFLKALESIGSFKWRGVPFAAWLFRIAHNAVIDHSRRKVYRESLPFSGTEVAKDDPAKEAELRIAMRDLKAALAQLTETQRQVITLRFAAGLSLKEAASVLGKNEGAVKAAQHSAVAALRRIVGQE